MIKKIISLNKKEFIEELFESCSYYCCSKKIKSLLDEIKEIEGLFSHYQHSRVFNKYSFVLGRKLGCVNEALLKTYRIDNPDQIIKVLIKHGILRNNKHIIILKTNTLNEKLSKGVLKQINEKYHGILKQILANANKEEMKRHITLKSFCSDLIKAIDGINRYSNFNFKCCLMRTKSLLEYFLKVIKNSPISNKSQLLFHLSINGDSEFLRYIEKHISFKLKIWLSLIEKEGGTLTQYFRSYILELSALYEDKKDLEKIPENRAAKHHMRQKYNRDINDIKTLIQLKELDLKKRINNDIHKLKLKKELALSMDKVIIEMNKLIKIQLECVATMKQPNDDSKVRLTPIAPKTPRWNE